MPRIKNPKHWMCENYPLDEDGLRLPDDAFGVCEIGHRNRAGSKCGSCPTGHIDWKRVERAQVLGVSETLKDERVEESNDLVEPPEDPRLKELYLKCLRTANKQGILSAKKLGIENLSELEPLFELDLVDKVSYKDGVLRWRVPKVAKRRTQFLGY
ncbi:MAG: hypothetical protein PHW75_02780 [Patescibacteria group bacterium]|nr:hypothetical protein [Patescibacteria group bacterium]